MLALGPACRTASEPPLPAGVPEAALEDPGPLAEPGFYFTSWDSGLVEQADERPWVGADWHATRQQDWRLRPGRVECLDARAGTAGRTLALLTHTIEGPLASGVRVTLELEAAEFLDEGGAWQAGAHAGLLFGIGGPGVDPRRSALVQQAPGEDGGYLLAVDHEGRLVLRSFEQPVAGGYWTLPTRVDHGALPLLAEGERTTSLDRGPLELSLEYVPGATLGRGLLRAFVAPVGHLGMPVVLEVEDFAAADLLGSLSLFSARGAAGSELGFAFGSFSVEGATAHPERARGPILAATYLVDGQPTSELGTTLRMTAHLAAVGAAAPRSARLWLEATWEEARPRSSVLLQRQADPTGAEAPVTWRLAALGQRSSDGGDLVGFEVPDYQDRSDGQPRRYRVEYTAVPGAQPSFYHGSIRPVPGADEPLVLASLSCLKNQVGPIAWNASGLWFPHEELVAGVLGQDPDLVYFSGDQIYEGDLTGPDRRSLAISIADYRTKFDRFLWAFEDILRHRPSVLVPDDHDVFHGNLWGAGGQLAEARDGLTVQDSGGYKMPAEFVNVVHASLVGNLPPTRVEPLIGQGITTYTTSFSWGGVDFAVLADRMWKDSPSVAAPEADFKNGWMQADGYDARELANHDAVLLGKPQEFFLAEWGATDQPDTWTKVVLSQSPFACLHTLPAGTKSDSVVGRQEPPAPGEYPPNDAPVADGDSNGWPQTGRNRAVALLREAEALHLCGDQHLGTVAQYGIDAWRDGTVAFTSPAMGNTWPRRWMPATPGTNRPLAADGKPLTPRYTGDYHDGFGNRVTMLSVANPEENGRAPRLQMNRAPGYGIVRFDAAAKRVTLEAWPTWSIDEPGTMSPGWPIPLGPTGRPAPNTPWTR
ncbi:MAG: alkaline phosphatase D family protein [Planctomycetota bacterium]|nr:alkaline phosphatase D family protein [Planctomycetota bacterium]